MQRCFYIFALLIALLLTVPGLAVASPEDDCFAANGQWKTDESRCIIQTGIRIDLDYPVELASQPVVAETIDPWLAGMQGDFVASYAPDFALPSYANNWTLTASYEIYEHSTDVASLVYTVGNYTGGAHPNYLYVTYTFDFIDQSLIALEDLFMRGGDPWLTIAPLVETDLREQLGDAADASWIADGAGGNPDNYRAFALTEDALVFFFAPYQVAAYAAGGLEVRLPLDALEGVIRPQFLAAG
jgi:hypothetical protein